MSDEKIDLAEIEEDAREYYVMRRDDTLALVAVARAARASAARPTSVNNWKALDAALAPFTDSAEVRSDD